MKYNSCLLDRLYSTKCNYMQIHFSLWLLTHYMHKKKRKKRCLAYKRSCTYFCMKIENIKARCAPIVYIMLQRTCSTKRPTREWPDNTLPGTQRYGYTGLVTGQRQNLALMNSSQSHFYARLQPDPTGSTSNTGSKSDRVKQAIQKLQF